MKRFDAVRALKDPTYLEGLSDQQRAQVSSNPAGSADLNKGVLESANGGNHMTSFIPTLCLACQR